MKLAEALNERAYLKKTFNELKERATANVKYQDGDSGPAEDPNKLIETMDDINKQLYGLIVRINLTNSSTRINDPLNSGSEVSLAELIVERDGIMRMINAMTAMRDSTVQRDRYSRNEIKYVMSIDISKLNEDINMLSRKYRMIDSALQAANWSTDLVD